MKELRESRGISPAQLARKMGVSLTSVYRYETGDRHLTAEKVEQVARALGVEPGELFAASPLVGASPRP